MEREWCRIRDKGELSLGLIHLLPSVFTELHHAVSTHLKKKKKANADYQKRVWPVWIQCVCECVPSGILSSLLFCWHAGVLFVTGKKHFIFCCSVSLWLLLDLGLRATAQYLSTCVYIRSFLLLTRIIILDSRQHFKCKHPDWKEVWMKGGNISVWSGGCLRPWQDFSRPSGGVVRVFTLVFSLLPEGIETYTPLVFYFSRAI